MLNRKLPLSAMKWCGISAPRKFARAEEPSLLTAPAARRTQSGSLPRAWYWAFRADTGSLLNSRVLPKHARSGYLLLLILQHRKGTEVLEWKSAPQGDRIHSLAAPAGLLLQLSRSWTEPREIPQMLTDQGSEISHLAPGIPLFVLWLHQNGIQENCLSREDRGHTAAALLAHWLTLASQPARRKGAEAPCPRHVSFTGTSFVHWLADGWEMEHFTSYHVFKFHVVRKENPVCVQHAFRSQLLSSKYSTFWWFICCLKKLPAAFFF